MTRLPFTPLVASLPSSVPFVGPEAHERALGRPFKARLGANESVFGPSPRAIEAMRTAAGGVWMYGDPENHDLREALAAHCAVAAERIQIGEGIDGLLQVVTRLFIAEGTPVVASAGAYPTFLYHAHGCGAVLHSVPLHDDFEDLPALAQAAHETGAALAYLVNPNNPMGTFHSAEALSAFLAALPSDTVALVDEAYVEFAPERDVLPLAVDDPRLIRLRTFAKAYGLAGARIGYAIASAEVATAMNKVRNHFGVNRIAQAGALAALGDQDYLAAVVEKVASARQSIEAIAASHRLAAVPSAANFVAIDLGGDPEAAAAQSHEVVATLAERGIFVRRPFAAPQNRCVRVSAGTAEDLAVFADAFGEVLTAGPRLRAATS